MQILLTALKTVAGVFMLCLIFQTSLLAETADMSIQITSPENGQRFSTCADIHLNVDITVQSGEISRVSYYQNGRSIRSVRQAPYDYLWEQVKPGIYNITAMVRDADRNEYYADPVQIFVDPITDGNLVINGEFACDTSPWNLSLNGDAQATLEIEPEGWLSDHAPMAIVDITQLSTAGWHVMLEQPFPVDSGHVYEIWFWAEVAEQKSVSITLQEQANDYTVHFNQAINLDYNTIEYGPFEFDCHITDSQSFLKIILGEDQNMIGLDNIQIYDKGWEPNTTRVKQTSPMFPKSVELQQNYPNPFNPGTDIQFSIPRPSETTLTVYDIRGRLVNTVMHEYLSAGSYTHHWDGRDESGRPVSSGIYMYKLQTSESVTTKRMVLLR